MSTQLDPRVLLTFGAVCRAGSISGAARNLNLSQPSVSNAIMLLERKLGVMLFERTRRGIILTEEGRALAWRAEALEVLLGSARDEVDAARNGAVGPLRVGGTPGALVSLLPGAVEQLERIHSSFALNVIERPDRDLTDMLRSGEIELAFVTTEIEEPPPGIRETTLSRDPFSLIVGKRHRALPSEVSLAELKNLRWVLPEAQGAFRRQVSALFVASGIAEPRDAVRCDSLLTTKAIVRNTDRITILPRQVAAAELSVGVLRAIAIREAAFERSIGVRMLEATRQSPLAAALLQAAKKSIV